MTAFYVGQRVRKVAGEWNIGAIGNIEVINATDPFGMTVGVCFNTVVRGERDDDLVWAMPGHVCFCHPEDIAPLTDAHSAAEWEAIEALLPGIRDGVPA